MSVGLGYSEDVDDVDDVDDVNAGVLTGISECDRLADSRLENRSVSF